jgi:fructose-1,6-bisphosphatase/inositol monophosphatase family enzyme
MEATPTVPTETELRGYLDFAEETAYTAGDIMLKYFDADVMKRTKSDNTIVTIADEEINEMVIERGNHAYPDASILGEEASDMKEGSEDVWVCDPIDGTYNFANGLPISVFSLALTRNGKPIVGTVFDPFMNRLYSAALGQGAYLNHDPIHVNDELWINRQRVGMSGAKHSQLDMAGVLGRMLHLNDMRPLYLVCSVQEAMMVATGKMVGSIYSGTKAHDVAASKIIVEEAGGMATDLKGRDQRYDCDVRGTLMSNARVHNQMIDLIWPYLADKQY